MITPTRSDRQQSYSQREALVIETYDYDNDLVEATRLDGQPRLRVYPARRTELVLGRGSKVEQEIFIDACIEDRIPLARRRGGGCSVFMGFLRDWIGR